LKEVLNSTKKRGPRASAAAADRPPPKSALFAIQKVRTADGPDGPRAGAAAAIVLASPCWPRRVAWRRHVSHRRSRPPLTAGSAPAAPPGMEEKARGDWGGRRGRDGKVVGGEKGFTTARDWHRGAPIDDVDAMSDRWCGRRAGSASSFAGGPSVAQKRTIRQLMFNCKKNQNYQTAPKNT